nr:transposase [Heyndrickxia coagulans]
MARAHIDKKDGKEKHEVVTVEEFISRLIRYIPDEQFKTIRYYGMYSRRSKKISKKLLITWQKQVRKWVVKVQKVLRRQTWRERIIASGKKDPMICPHCGNYYEYMGEVCLEDGKLSVKIALSRDARIYMERMIDHITGYKQETKKRKEEKTRNRTYSPQETVRQLSLFDVS